MQSSWALNSGRFERTTNLYPTGGALLREYDGLGRVKAVEIGSTAPRRVDFHYVGELLSGRDHEWEALTTDA